MRSSWGALGGANVDLSRGVLRHDLGVVGSFLGAGAPESSRLVSATVEFGDEPVNGAIIADVCRDCADRTLARERAQFSIIRSDLDLVSRH